MKAAFQQKATPAVVAHAEHKPMPGMMGFFHEAQPQAIISGEKPAATPCPQRI